MFFEIVENDIKGRISSEVGNAIDVENLPEKQSDFSIAFAKAKVSVCFSMSEFDKPKSTGYTVQQADAQFELMIQARALRGANGIYDVFDKVRKAVVGYAPVNCGRIYAVSFKPDRREDNVWYYVFTIALRSELVISANEPTTIPEWAVAPGGTANTVPTEQITAAPLDAGFPTAVVPQT